MNIFSRNGIHSRNVRIKNRRTTRIERAISRVLVERLEERRLLSATLDITGGALTYTAATASSGLTISSDGTTETFTDTQTITLTANATDAAWSGSGTNTVTGPESSISSMAISTSSTSGQSLTVDFGGGGDPLPASGLIYDPTAASGLAANTLNLEGGSFTSETYSPTGAGAGTITYSDASNSSVPITFSNLSPITDTVASPTFIFDAPAAATTVNVVNGPNVGGTQTDEINDGGSGAFELIDFGNKTDATVNINNAGATTTTDVTTAAAGLASLFVNSGAGSDTVDVQATPSGVVTTVDTGSVAGSSINVGLAGSLSSISGVVVAQATGGSGTLVLNDGSDTTSSTATFDNGSGNDNAAFEVTGLSPAAIEYAPSITSVTVNGGTDGGNGVTFDVNNTQSGTTLTLNGGADANTFNLSNASESAGLDNLQGSVVVNGGSSGSDAIVLDDSSADFNDSYTITSTTVGRIVFGGLTYGDIGSLTLNAENTLGTNGNNTIDINSTADGVNYNINGQDGVDTIDINDTGTGGTLDVSAGGTDGSTINVVANNEAVNLSLGAEDAVNIGSTGGAGTLANIQGAIGITDGPAFYSLAFHDENDTTGHTWTLNDNDSGDTATVALSGGIGTTTYRPGDVDSLTINGGSGGNTYNVNNTSADFVTTLNGGTGNNVVNVSATGDNTLNINGQGGSDSVNLGGSATTPKGMTGLLGTINVSNATGSTGLFLNDSENTAASSPTLNDDAPTGTGTFTGVGSSTIIFADADLSSLEFDGGSGGNTITIDDTSDDYTTTINTGDGNDTVSVDYTGFSGSPTLNIDGDEGADKVTLGNSSDGMQYFYGTVNVYSNTGSVALTLNDSANHNSTTGTLNDNGTTGTVTGLGAGATINLTDSDISSLTINESYNGDTFTIDNTSDDFTTTVNTSDYDFNVVNVDSTGSDSSLVVNTYGYDNTVNVNSSGDSSNVTVNGNDYSGNSTYVYGTGTGSTLTINGDGGSDNFVTVDATGSGSTVNIHGQGGSSDIVFLGDNSVGMTELNGTITVDNTSGSTALTLDDYGDTTSRNVTITDTSVTGLSSNVTIDYTDGDLDRLTIDGGSAYNSFTVDSASDHFTTYLNTGSYAGDNVAVNDTDAYSGLNVYTGGDSDTVTINYSGYESGVTVRGGGYDGELVNISNTGKYSTVEVLGGGGDNDLTNVTEIGNDEYSCAVNIYGQGGSGDAVILGDNSDGMTDLYGTITVTNTGGSTNLTLNDSGDGDGVDSTVTDNQVTGFNDGDVAVDFTGTDLSSLTIDGGFGNNFTTVESTDANYGTFINGQGGDDTVIISNNGSTSAVLGDVTITNPGGHTALTIDSSQDDISHNLDLTGGQTTTVLTSLSPGSITYTTAEIGSLTIDTSSSGTQVMTVDFTNGNPIPTFDQPGLIFNAGGNQSSAADSHALNIIGELPTGAFLSETHDANDPNISSEPEQYGTISFVDAASNDSEIQYTGLQPIEDVTPADTYTFIDNGDDQSFSMTDGGTYDGAQTIQIANTPTSGTVSFETTNFANKTNVVIDLPNQNSAVLGNIDIPTPSTGLASLTVNFENSDDNLVNVIALPPGISTTINEGGGNDLTEIDGAQVPTGTILTLSGGAGINTLDYDANGETPTVTAGSNLDDLVLSIPGFGTVDANGYAYVNIHDIAPLTITPGAAQSFNAVAGVPVNDQIIATFTAPLPTTIGTAPSGLPASDLTGGITWGDGTANVAAESIVQDTSDPSVYDVLGGAHTFATGGVFSVANTFQLDGGSYSQFLNGVDLGVTVPATAVIAGTSATADVTSLTAGTPVTLTLTTGEAVPGTIVGTFTDANPNATVGEFTATINWGDGDITNGTITQPGGIGTPFDVTGSHAYNEAGTYSFSVLVTDQDGASVTLTGTANVTGTALTEQTTPPIVVENKGVAAFVLDEGVPVFSVPVSTFTDANSSPSASSFSAVIDWGDGSPTTVGTVVVTPGTEGGPSTITVEGSHTYQVNGQFTVTVSTDDGDGHEVTTTTTASVGPRLQFVTQPSNTVAGNILSPVTVEALDVNGNLLTNNHSTVRVAIYVDEPAGAIFYGYHTAVLHHGVATFRLLRLTHAATYLLKATDGVIAPAISDSFAITPSNPTHLGFTSIPTDATADETFDVDVAVLDQFGNVVTDDESSVVLGLDGVHPAGAVLSGSTTEPTNNGVAEFEVSVLDSGKYKLKATDTEVAGKAVSPKFTVEGEL
jgi:hypothetical protein